MTRCLTMVVLAAFAITGCAGSSPEAEAEAAIEQFGGSVTHRDGYVSTVKLEKSRAQDADLAALGSLTHVEAVYLPDSITDAGLVHIEPLTSLVRLDLQKTQVTDAGLEHLKGLANLKAVYTFGSKVTDQGAQALKQAIPGLTVETFPIERP